jgi:hypothetical protein
VAVKSSKIAALSVTCWEKVGSMTNPRRAIRSPGLSSEASERVP